ncbi:hypothetical protein ABZ595_10570 [Streptomyces rubradiris]|uniref:dTMP kinase n=1 Tax=Streptomyces rubradiris TaxID=285531 RepID=UPI0033F92E9E
MTGFWTLVGPDFSGKSTVLERLRDDYGWHVISHGGRDLDAYPLIRTIRDTWLTEAYPRTGTRYSSELTLAALHTVVLHLRDELARAADRERVIVDSYYYKLLAKCSLLGVRHDETFHYWRSFPQPKGVVYLHADPEVTWERAGRGSRLNPFEYAGDRPSREGFAELQSQLRGALLKEVAELPLTVVDSARDQETVLCDVLEAVGSEEVR